MFRFTIRDLLWLTVVAAFAVAWRIHDQQLQQAVQFANARTAELEGYCEAAGLEVVWTADGGKVVRPPQQAATYP